MAGILLKPLVNTQVFGYEPPVHDTHTLMASHNCQIMAVHQSPQTRLYYKIALMAGQPKEVQIPIEHSWVFLKKWTDDTVSVHVMHGDTIKIQRG